MIWGNHQKLRKSGDPAGGNHRSEGETAGPRKSAVRVLSRNYMWFATTPSHVTTPDPPERSWGIFEHAVYVSRERLSACDELLVRV